MVLVLLSHFGGVYFQPVSDTALPHFIESVTMVASPTFMIISGLLLGSLCTTKPNRVDQFRQKLWDRGLFLLTVGHVAIALVFVLFKGSFRYVFITDAVGVSMLVGAYLVDKLTPRGRLILSAGAYFFSWAAIAWWHPHATWARYVTEGLFGTAGHGVYLYSFPLVPWFSVYFASSVIGERLGTMYLNGDVPRIARALFRGGLAAAAAACAIKATFKLSQNLFDVVPPAEAVTSLMLAVHGKMPPSPVYLLFYGGIGLVMLSAFCAAELRHPNAKALKLAGTIGRNSLFVFILQFYVYYVVLDRLHLTPGVLWPLYLLASVVFIVAATIAYDRRGYSRFMTVGLPRFQHRLQHIATALAGLIAIGR